MRELGFHNCALISHEQPMRSTQRLLRKRAFENVTKVALLPCREPVDHFFSQCNHHNLSVVELFRNSTSCKPAERCFVSHDRFVLKTFVKTFDEVVLFHYDSIESVLRFLDNHMPMRRVTLPPGQQYTTNAPRKPDQETLPRGCDAAALESYLKSTWTYFEFCSRLPVERNLMTLVRRGGLFTSTMMLAV